VSEAAAADDEAVALADEDEDEELPELPQAAASTVSGTRAAAVHTRRIRLATGKYSFVSCTSKRAFSSSRAGCAR
jgi:hypothetical protein